VKSLESIGSVSTSLTFWGTASTEFQSDQPALGMCLPRSPSTMTKPRDKIKLRSHFVWVKELVRDGSILFYSSRTSRLDFRYKVHIYTVDFLIQQSNCHEFTGNKARARVYLSLLPPILLPNRPPSLNITLTPNRLPNPIKTPKRPSLH